MKITVTNQSTTHAVTARTRLPNQPRQDESLAPGASRTFDLPADTSVSFLQGAEAETPIRLQAPAPAAPAPAAPIPNPASGVAAPTRAELEAMDWPALRKRAIDAGAPKTVSKADAIELLLKTNA